MIVTWTDDNGITHTGSAEGRAYKRHKAEQAKAAARPSEPVGTVESGLIRAIPNRSPRQRHRRPRRRRLSSRPRFPNQLPRPSRGSAADS